MIRLKYANASQIVKSVDSGCLDDFISELAEHLMLDELLRGECEPAEFLKEQIRLSANQVLIKRTENRLIRLKECGSI